MRQTATIRGELQFRAFLANCEAWAKQQFQQQKAIVLTVRSATRSTDQNARMWAMLTDIANQVDWYGKKLSKEHWKDMITAALKKQEVVPGIDGGFVVIGARTSEMTIQEMSDVIAFADAFGAEHGVRFTAPEYA